MHPFGQSQSKINFAFNLKFSWIVDQSKPDSHYDSQIDPYISCILIEYVCSKMQHKCLGGTEYPTPGETYHAQMYGVCTK